jgi:pimeloyl-ACP methyl ester carboxylesterase
VTRLSKLRRRGVPVLACVVLSLCGPGAIGDTRAASLSEASARDPLPLPVDSTVAESPLAPASQDVVLLHGLGRSARVMRPLALALTAAGYRIHNLEYPSTRATPEAIVEVLHGEISSCCAWSGRVNFVTHSLGGVMLRAYLAKHPMPQLGRVVMLAPPNHGSEYVDVAGGFRLFASVLGPTAAQLGTSPTSLPNRLPGADFEVGVIAGSGSINPLGAVLIDGADDGTVSVASTRLTGMRDWIEVPVSHTFIMRNREVARQTIEFLRAGSFAR